MGKCHYTGPNGTRGARTTSSQMAHIYYDGPTPCIITIRAKLIGLPVKLGLAFYFFFFCGASPVLPPPLSPPDDWNKIFLSS